MASWPRPALSRPRHVLKLWFWASAQNHSFRCHQNFSHFCGFWFCHVTFDFRDVSALDQFFSEGYVGLVLKITIVSGPQNGARKAYQKLASKVLRSKLVELHKCTSKEQEIKARCCLGQASGGAPFSQRSRRATACTNRMQINN